MDTFPHIQVSGGAYERGRQLGAQAGDRIARSIEIYKQIFAHYAEWEWDQVTEHAALYHPKIEAYAPRYLEEIDGMALGSGLDPRDLLAINVRTEVMFAAVARQAARECTAFVALPEVTGDGHVLIAQSWDWKPEMIDTVIVLEAEQEEGPNFVTVVEAGLLAKTGFNSAGIGLATNALVSHKDVGSPGVPYHIILRAILDTETMSGALGAVLRQPRASSANYLIAHRDGLAINVEAAPGDFSRTYLQDPERGMFVHTNHFGAPDFDLKDVTLWNGPDSPFRRQRMRALLEKADGELTAASAQSLFHDHVNHPFGICTHPDPRLDSAEQYATVSAVIMDLSTSKLWISDGLPCESPFRELDYADFLDKPTGVAQPARKESPA
jgi:isopenicillin-N N-acyltransferase-like protein